MKVSEKFQSLQGSAPFHPVAPSLDSTAFGQLLFLVNHLPGVCIFAKDESSVIIFASKSMAGRFGLRSASEIVGKCDHDFFPGPLADGFIRDDRHVMRSGTSLTSRVEFLFDEHGIFNWYATTKAPLYNSRGVILGVMGTTQSIEEGRDVICPNPRIRRAVERIHFHFRDKLMIADLAKISSLSERQFRRQFPETFEMSPQEFILNTRIQNLGNAIAS